MVIAILMAGDVEITVEFDDRRVKAVVVAASSFRFIGGGVPLPAGRDAEYTRVGETLQTSLAPEAHDS